MSSCGAVTGLIFASSILIGGAIGSMAQVDIADKDRIVNCINNVNVFLTKHNNYKI